MKILQIHKYYSKKRGGGSVAAFFETKELLESMGHEVMVFAMHDPDNEYARENVYFAEHFDIRATKNVWQKIRLLPRVLYNREAMEKLDLLLKKKKPDVAHVHNIYHYLTPGIFRVLKKHGVPIVFKLSDYHAICPNYTLFSHGKIDNSCKNGSYYKIFFNKSIGDSWSESFVGMVEGYVNRWRRFYDDVDIFVAPSEFMRKICVTYGIPAEKIVILRNVLNFRSYPEQIVPKSHFFLYMGRIAPEKGLPVLIVAVQKLKERNMLGEWHCVIAGKGPEEKKLRDLVQKEGLADVISFAGFHQKGSREWFMLMQQAAVAVLPSVWYDNSPIAISESMACTTPVIVSDAGGTKEMIEDGVSGYVFQSENVTDLADKMQKFIDDPSLCDRMGVSARERVFAINNEKTYYTRLMDIYDKAIKKHTK
jgi:glycosyltransferase involved in cell wall biosynthesis